MEKLDAAFTLNISKTTKKALNVIAINNDTNMAEIIRELIENYVKQHTAA